MTRRNEWTRCSCGHIAQDHNLITEANDHYGCDCCGCMNYDGHVHLEDGPSPSEADMIEAARHYAPDAS